MSDAGVSGPRWRPSGHCIVFACDIAGFGDASRTDDVRRHMRDALYRQLDVSLAAGGVSLAECYWEDRGDGVMIAVPPGVPVETLLVDVADMLKAELTRYNKVAAEIAQIRLRVSVHTGEAGFDGRGLVGTAVNHTFRILEARPFKEALRDSGAWFALVASQRVYEDVIRHSPGRIIPDDYQRIDVSVKETETSAWIRVQSAVGRPASSHGLATTDPSEVSSWAGTPSAPAPGPGPERPSIFELVDRMMEIPLLASARGREQMVTALRGEIAGAVSRQPEARMDCFAILTTCLDYPGGLKELLAVTRGLSGESLSVHRLEQEIARFL